METPFLRKAECKKGLIQTQFLQVHKLIEDRSTIDQGYILWETLAQ